MNNFSIISNIFWKFSERILAQTVSLTVSIILARLLEPDDYGVIAFVTIFIALADVFVTSGIPNALIQKKNADDNDFSSVFYFNLGLSGVLYLILYFLAPLIANFYGNAVLVPITRVMGIRLIAAAVNSVQHSYVSRHMMFRKYFWSTLSGTLISGFLGTVMAYMGFGAWALAAQYMINTLTDTAVLFLTVPWRPRLFFSWNRIAGLLAYGWKILFEGVANTAAGQVRNLMIGKVYSSADLGAYTKAGQFPQVIVGNISEAVSSVLFPAMSDIQDDLDRVKKMLRKSVRMISYVVFPMLTGLAAVAEPFIRLVLTEKWVECVPYLQIFCFTNMAAAGMYPRHQALNGTGRSDVFMMEHMFSRIISFMILFLVYKRGVMAIALSGIVSSVIMTATVMYTSRRFNQYFYREQIKDILPSVTGCMIMGFPVYMMNYCRCPDGMKLSVQVTAGILTYFIYSIFFHLEEFQIIKEYAKRVIKRMTETIEKKL